LVAVFFGCFFCRRAGFRFVHRRLPITPVLTVCRYSPPSTLKCRLLTYGHPHLILKPIRVEYLHHGDNRLQVCFACRRVSGTGSGKRGMERRGRARGGVRDCFPFSHLR
jgi:hypothetical protein